MGSQVKVKSATGGGEALVGAGAAAARLCASPSRWPPEPGAPMSHRRGAREKAEAAPAERRSHKRPRSQREPLAGSSGGCRELERHEQKRKKREVQQIQQIQHLESFYEKPPPGLIKEDETKPEDCIPDVPGNEHAREFLAHAPTKGLWMPLGKEVKVMQCWRCKRYGHRTGDKECPFFIKGNQKLEQFRVAHEDPMYDVIRENKRHEKEMRIQQLKQLLEDSSSDEDGSSGSSSSSECKEKHKKKKKKEKKKKEKKKKKKRKHKSSKSNERSESD
ncbi:putative E3 ubiquitin-protein ligase HERC1 [Platysternon megacephalum]|uniref:Putative E3 ubiquitin-protein ligase HERC1 n=1 Tax=Platysternon megacephalum TaxID=55544 RepID=A0A4D9ENY8_9SAUR|nr:putative E3 ubiquitin-protein ligase HERC1 [Platysternon megacephalum]